MAQTLDVTSMDQNTAHEALESALAKLDDSQSIIIESNQDLRPLLPALQEKQWGAFDWAPLIDGPQLWQVELTRCADAPSGRSIRGMLATDHRRCDLLFAALEESVQNGDMDATEKLNQQFQLAMIRHFRMEEDVFFPAFEQRTGMTQGPTTVMRMEHDQMRGIMSQMAEAVSAKSLDAVQRTFSTLLVLMQQHNIKEEQMLYAMGDQQLGDMAQDLLKKMQKL
ncbi:MAG: hemerythrin domain-containing protein [Magnetococcales bacterium]|nr:hemerythrin domain-containing protein [Magnetococcales bacterium]